MASCLPMLTLLTSIPFLAGCKTLPKRPISAAPFVLPRFTTVIGLPLLSAKLILLRVPLFLGQVRLSVRNLTPTRVFFRLRGRLVFWQR